MNSEKQFYERVCAVCKRNVYYDMSGKPYVQINPNPLGIQLRFRRFGANELPYADIYIPSQDRWLLLFWYSQPTFKPGCYYHLQENTNIQGPDGIIDHKFSKTLTGCLNTLERLLNE